MTTKENKAMHTMMADAHHDFQKGLNARAFFKVGDHATSEDLVQDTFMKTWKHLVGGGKILMMKAFLYHVLNHLIIDEYRKRKSSSLDDLLEKGFEPGVDETESIFNIFDGKALLLLIKRLPVKYRKTLKMHYVQDLSLTEISLITGTSKNTIAVQLHRGVKKLKLIYEKA
jgi:RNA polymerase sigma-70 factor (ECF subfamily)